MHIRHNAMTQGPARIKGLTKHRSTMDSSLPCVLLQNSYFLESKRALKKKSKIQKKKEKKKSRHTQFIAFVSRTQKEPKTSTTQPQKTNPIGGKHGKKHHAGKGTTFPNLTSRRATPLAKISTITFIVLKTWLNYNAIFRADTTQGIPPNN